MAKCKYTHPRSLYRRLVGSLDPIGTGVRGTSINDGLIEEVLRNLLLVGVAVK